GAGSNTLTGDNSGDLFNITGINTGNVTGLVTGFANIQNLIGGTGNDTFTLSGTGHISGVINGGGGGDTLVGNNLMNAWAISGANAGTLTDANGSNNFTDISNLTGGSGNDDFMFVTGGLLGGNLIGGGGTDTLDYSGLVGPVNVVLTSISGGLATGTGPMIGGNFSGISILNGSGSSADMLTGPNQANNWQITGADAGNVDGFQFTSIENLTGGASTNQFVLNGGTLSGNINSGSGSAAGNSLQANNGSNTWHITAVNQGTVTGIGGNFGNIGNLTGGTGADDFVFANGATLSGTLNGGGGNDILDWSAYTIARNVTLTGPGSLDGMRGTEASIAGGFDNIITMTGANGTGGLLNSLTGPNSSNTWNVTTSNAGTLNGALSFSNFQTLTGGSGADTFNLSAGVRGSINGGGGLDTANIVNSFTAPAPTLTINNIGTIADNAGATITATILAISGASSIGSASHPLLGNLTGLQIRVSNGNAFISTGSVDLEGINLGSGNLTLNSSGTVTDASGQSVIADTLDLTAVAGIGTASAPIDTVIDTLDSAVSGAGSIYINNSGAIALGAISTTNGAINVASSGALTSDGPISSGGNGAITLTTSGGDLTTAGVIAAGGSGDVNLSAAGNLNLDSSVSSGTGALLLTGGTGVTGNSSGVLSGGAVNVTATSGNIIFTGVSSGATGGTTLTASGITLQGFTTTLGALTVRNGGAFLVSGPVNLSGGLDQTGAGSVVLDSSISSRSGNVQFASSVSVGSSVAASITTSGGNIIFNRDITGSGSTSSLALNSSAGNIELQATSNLGTLNLQTSGTLSLGGNLSANTLLTTGVTGNVLIVGTNVNISTANSSVDFSHTTGIDGLNVGSQSLVINAGTGNVILPAVGQTTSLKSLTVDGGTITLANVTTNGNQLYTGSVRLGGNLVSLDNGGVTLNGSLALLSNAGVSAAGGGNISINGDVNGARALTLTTPSGAVLLGGDVGASTALASLSVTSATTSMGSVTTSGTQSYQSGSTRFAGMLNSKSGAINFGGTLVIASASVIQANSIGFNGGASSVHGNTTLILLPETNGLAVNIGGSGSGLTLNNTAMNGYDGDLYIGTGPGPGSPYYITHPSITNPYSVFAGNVTVNGSLMLGSSGTLLLAGLGNLILNSGTLSANYITLIAGSQNSVIENPGGSSTSISANKVILVSGGQIGNPGRELNIAVSGSNPQVQVATGALQIYMLPPTLPIVIGPAALIANDIANQLGLFIQANSQVTSSGQQIAALVQTGGLLGGFIDVSLFQDVSLYDIYGQGITLPVDQCEQPNSQRCSQ
ncbi:MAG: beta strand repeat-containing protein, partial [Gammaproteobacteria bacterium]